MLMVNLMLVAFCSDGGRPRGKNPACHRPQMLREHQDRMLRRYVAWVVDQYIRSHTRWVSPMRISLRVARTARHESQGRSSSAKRPTSEPWPGQTAPG